MPLIVTKGLGSAGGGGLQLDTLDSVPGGVLLFSLKDGATSITPVLTGPAADPANWSVTGPSSITVTDVYVSGQQVIIRTTFPLLYGQMYTLAIPLGIASTTSVAYYGPFSLTFTAAGDSPVILMASSRDATTVDVVFDVAADSTALDPANYTIDGGLTILSIVKLTELHYRLTTTHQVMGASYDVASPGVLAGPPFYPRTLPPAPNLVYSGLAAVPGSFDATFITSLASQFNSSSFGNTVEFPAPTAGQYAFYAFPSSYGTVDTVVDTTSWLAFPFNKVATAVMVSGAPYDVYQSAFAPAQPFVTRWY